MANTLEFILKLKDMMSGGMQKVSTTAQSAFNAVDRKISSVQRNMQHTGRSVDSLSRRLDDLRKTRDLSINRRDIIAANREIDRLERRINHMHTMGVSRRGGRAGAGIMGMGMSRMAAGIAGVGLVAGLTTGIGASASLGMQSTATRTSMEVLAGEQKGAQLFTNLNKFAKDSIFGNEVYKNSQTLMGFGVAADNVMPRIKMLGDISMGNKQRFEMLTLAYAQTQAAGRLMGQDVLQMINAGFNPLQEISLMTGVSMAKLKERMEQGAISSDMVTKAFEHATKAGGRFFNMTEKIGNTPFGKWEALKGQTADVGRQIGEQMAPYIGAAIDKYARPLMDWMEETVVPRVAGFMEGIGGFVETMMPHVIQLGQTLSRVGTVVWEFITSESMANLSTSIIDLTSDIGNVLVPALEAVADVLEPLAYLLSPIVDMIGGIFNIIHSDANFTGAVAGYQHVRDEQMKMMEAYNKSITAGKSLFVDLNKLVDPRYPKPGTPYPALVSPYTPSTIGGASSPGAANGAGISQTDFNSLNDTNKTISASGPRMITVNFNRALVEGNTVNVNSVEEAEGFFDEKIQQSVVRAMDAYLKQ